MRLLYGWLQRSVRTVSGCRIDLIVVEKPDDPTAFTGRSIVRMIDSVVDREALEIEGADADQACGVDAILVRVRASPVVRVYPALRAEVMLSLHRVKLVQTEQVFAAGKGDVAKLGRDRNGPPHSTIGAGASACGRQAVRQLHPEAD
jgi:hypothetical protein